MPLYQITPLDLLMFRDGRPIEPLSGSGAHGARWPEPSIIFDALHAALYRAFPEVEREADGQPTWEHKHRFGRSSNRDNNRKPTQRFGSLATAGPFPVLHGEWLLSAPQDVTRPDEFTSSLLPITRTKEQSDLPPPLVHALGSRVAASKEVPRPWWNKAAWDRYLGFHPSAQVCPLAFKDDDVFLREWTVGIGIDPATETAGRGSAQSQIYSAEYLRLRNEITLGIYATMRVKNDAAVQCEERLSRLFNEQESIIVGGQQRACQVEPINTSLDKLLPCSAPIAGARVKWVLLSPAVFPEIVPTKAKPDAIAHRGGWLPNWIAGQSFRDSQGRDMKPGDVLLKKGDTARGQREGREAWRQRIRKFDYIECRLVAARIPKPLVLTGWTERLHLADDPCETNALRKTKGPRPTLLAVPAGAVYYFEGKDAPLLSDALSWHGSKAENEDRSRIVNRRSTLLGEKGFGLGVCGPWEPFGAVQNEPVTQT